MSRSLLTLLALVVAGCATSHTAAVRKNVAPPGYSIDKLVVVGFSKDAPTRQTFEDAFSMADGERIYGLTERLRDSNIMIEENNGPMTEEVVQSPQRARHDPLGFLPGSALGEDRFEDSGNE